MACLLGLTTNMLDAFESTYAQLIAFYMAARLFMAVYCLCLAVIVAMVRPMMITQAGVALILCALWIGSIYIDMPNRIAIIWIAIFLDLTGSMFIVLFIRGLKFVSKRAAERGTSFMNFIRLSTLSIRQRELTLLSRLCLDTPSWLSYIRMRRLSA